MEIAVARQNLGRRLRIAAMALLSVIGLGVTGFTVLAPESSLLDRLYFAVVTLTTVGYGEVIQVTGRPGLMIFTMVYMVFGMGLLLFAVSTITATIIEVELDHVFRRRRMERRIAKLNQHFIVCGGGETGGHVMEEFRTMRGPFVLVEQDEDRCAHLAESMPDLLYIHGDATDEDVLKKAGVEQARGLCAVLPHDKDNLFLTLTARSMNDRLRIVARGIGPRVTAKLRRAGADAVVSATHIGGLRLASELARPHTVSFLDEMLRDAEASHRFGELPVREGGPWAGKRVRDVPLRDKHILAVAVRSPGGQFSYAPSADHVLEAGSTLIVLARTDTVAAVRAELLGSA